MCRNTDAAAHFFAGAKVKILLKGLKDNGCPFERKHFQCAVTNRAISGAFVSTQGVVVGSNQLRNKQHLEQVLTHELIHAYDYCRAKIDENDCRHLACAEIRAANLSGDCDLLREWGRLNFGFFGMLEKCVRRRAALAISNNPACNGQNVNAVVDSVYEDSMTDISPFDEDDLL
ncbi:peptidase M76 [Gaertneriomyces semiglobifer]|nr:peptidase M76 [Gaertneriomyces semiglobifer]